MIRVLQVAAVLCLSACSGLDATPIWTPGAPAPRTNVVPEPRETVVGNPVPGRPATNSRNALPQLEPRATSKTPLPSSERRSLKNDRQYLDSEINALKRREHFDGGRVRAVDERRLRGLKARRRAVIRRLRGD